MRPSHSVAAIQLFKSCVCAEFKRELPSIDSVDVYSTA